MGRVMAGLQDRDWGVSHAAYPTPLVLRDGTIRVFFSARDRDGRSHLASVDMQVHEGRFTLVSDVSGPLLTPGPRGAFDADGVTVSCVVPDGDRLLAYYLGWTVGVSVPFMNSIGLAIGDSGGETFDRVFQAPVLGRSEANPLTLGYPWVVRTADGWRMWFGSHLAWGERSREMTHVIKRATSHDGSHWIALDEISVPLAGASDPREFAVSRPVVLKEPWGWSMWYSKCNPHYHIGYAYSHDLLHWTRADNLIHFGWGPEDWENRERAYPCLFDHEGRRYMLYNGNDYGRTGFGIAMLEG